MGLFDCVDSASSRLSPSEVAGAPSEASKPLQLATLPDDVLDRIALVLQLPLQPAALVALASTSRSFARLLGARLRQLEQQHRKACARAFARSVQSRSRP